jgi:hypothetical protein
VRSGAGEVHALKAQCYQFRCSMLQEDPMLGQRLSLERVVFLISGPGSYVGPTMRANRVIALDLDSFCGDMTDAVQGYSRAVKWRAPFETHMAEIAGCTPEEFRAPSNCYRCSLSTSACHARGSIMPSKKR